MFELLVSFAMAAPNPNTTQLKGCIKGKYHYVKHKSCKLSKRDVFLYFTTLYHSLKWTQFQILSAALI